VKILHTSDVHLRETGDERWAALEAIAHLCTTEEVDLLVIAGDLFDTSSAAEELRPHLRELFSTGDFHTVVIPGNHDVDSYRPGYFFGKGVTFFNDDDFSSNLYDTEEARLIGLPFRPRDALDTARELRRLRAVLDPERCNILVYHGELLDAVYPREGFGPEDPRRYMPTKLLHFQELGVDYVLAGHFHVSFRIWTLGRNSFFVYAGSPVSITRREIGQRCVNLFEVGAPPSECFLDTVHFCELHITFDPTQHVDPVRLVEDRLGQAHPCGIILLTLDGYVTKNEAAIVNQVERLLESRPHVDPVYRFRDVTRVLNHPLVELFRTRLAEREPGAERAAELEDLLLRAVTEAGL